MRGKITGSEFEKSGYLGVAGKGVLGEEIIQKWNLNVAAVCELSGNISAQQLVDPALELYCGTTRSDGNLMGNQGRASIVRVRGKSVGNRALSLGRPVEDPVVTEMTFKDFVPRVVVQNGCCLLGRKIEVDPPLIQERRAADHIEVFDGDFETERISSGPSRW